MIHQIEKAQTAFPQINCIAKFDSFSCVCRGVVLRSGRGSSHQRYFLTVLVFALFFLPLCMSAQRSAPVAGDAATLTDYLLKDYSTGNPETVMEDIAADRSRVIAIFKAYAINLEESPNEKDINTQKEKNGENNIDEV